jgi:hypothetical protein
LTAGSSFVTPVGEKSFLVTAGAFCDRINYRPANSCFIELQHNAFLQIKLPMSESNFLGDPLPLTNTLSKSISHRTINFITVSRNARADGSTKIRRQTTKDLLHSFYGTAQQTSGRATPTAVDHRGYMLFLIV